MMYNNNNSKQDEGEDGMEERLKARPTDHQLVLYLHSKIGL